MTLNDAFHQLTIEQLEEALAADEGHGFPQDAFGLARLFLRTLWVIAPGCVNMAEPPVEQQDIDQAIERRITAMLQLEQLKSDHFEEADWPIHGSHNTRH